MIEGIITGITIALVWAIIIAGYNFFRNLLLEKKLNTAFERQGLIQSREGFGIAIRNNTPVPVIIRAVRVYRNYPEHAIDFSFEGPAPYPPYKEKVGKNPKSRKVTYYGPDKRQVEKMLDRHGFVELPSHTGGIWHIPSQAVLEELELQFETCQVIIDYPTVFGNRKIIAIMASPGMRDFINEEFEKYKEWIQKERKKLDQQETI